MNDDLFNNTEILSTTNDLALINSVAHKNYSVGEVYIFSVILCDNDIDKDFEYFDTDALEKLAKMFVGVTGIYNHNPYKINQAPRIFRCQAEKVPTKKTAYGAEYVRLVANAYLPVCEVNKDLIDLIDRSKYRIKKEVSVGCGIKECFCSICGKDMRIYTCGHQKGKSYDGKVCCGVLKSPTDVYEWAFTFQNQNETPQEALTCERADDIVNDVLGKTVMLKVVDNEITDNEKRKIACEYTGLLLSEIDTIRKFNRKQKHCLYALILALDLSLCGFCGGKNEDI